MELTRKQSSQFQQLADIPEPEFEEALNIPASVPTGHGILTSRGLEETLPRARGHRSTTNAYEPRLGVCRRGGGDARSTEAIGYRSTVRDSCPRQDARPDREAVRQPAKRYGEGYGAP